MLKLSCVFASLLMLFSCVAEPAKELGVEAQQIASQSQCVSVGGRWGRACMAQSEFCFVPSKDAGKGCNDSSECENRCLKAEPGQEQAGFAGVCQANNNPCGCFADISQGQYMGTLCID